MKKLIFALLFMPLLATAQIADEMPSIGYGQNGISSQQVGNMTYSHN